MKFSLHESKLISIHVKSMDDDTAHDSQTEAKPLLEEKVARSPAECGCYLWKDRDGVILYVGKANSLRSRLKSYLHPDTIKTRLLMEHADGLDWIPTETAHEALLLEANLIKLHQPRFNVRLKDDKRYPFLCLSLSEDYPRLFITRTIKDDRNRYFGPYSDVKATRNMLALIYKIFPIRKVPQKLPLKKPRRACMNYSIHRCLAPCQGNVSIDDYRKIIDEITLFLEGRREVLENLVVKRMNEYSQSTEYERAAVYRDILLNIRSTTEKQSVISSIKSDRDILGIATEGDQGQIAIMEIRGGRLLGRTTFPIVGTEYSTLAEIVSSFLRDHYLHAKFIPSKILLPLLIANIKDIEESLTEKAGHAVKIGTSKSKESQSHLQLAEKNAELLLKERILATKFMARNEALADIQTKLNLPKPPEVIECYDISHFQGSETVAAGICFIHGEPHPPSYRHYRIRSVDGIDDPKSIGEVIHRRVSRLLKENRPLPDLIVIDGGITQLNAALTSMKNLNVHIHTVGLAEQHEEIYFPGRSVPSSFDPNSPAMKVLRHARDEAHRFGITHHRKRMSNRLLRHFVDKIPDIGTERKKSLLKHFKNRSIHNATKEELMMVPGIGEAIAERILEHRNKH